MQELIAVLIVSALANVAAAVHIGRRRRARAKLEVAARDFMATEAAARIELASMAAPSARWNWQPLFACRRVLLRELGQKDREPVAQARPTRAALPEIQVNISPPPVKSPAPERDRFGMDRSAIQHFDRIRGRHGSTSGADVPASRPANTGAASIILAVAVSLAALFTLAAAAWGGPPPGGDDDPGPVVPPWQIPVEVELLPAVDAPAASLAPKVKALRPAGKTAGIGFHPSTIGALNPSRPIGWLSQWRESPGSPVRVAPLRWRECPDPWTLSGNVDQMDLTRADVRAAYRCVFGYEPGGGRSRACANELGSFYGAGTLDVIFRVDPGYVTRTPPAQLDGIMTERERVYAEAVCYGAAYCRRMEIEGWSRPSCWNPLSCEADRGCIHDSTKPAGTVTQGLDQIWRCAKPICGTGTASPPPPPPPPPAPRCGDGACNGAETCAACPADCGPCAPPPAVNPPVVSIACDEVRFVTTDSTGKRVNLLIVRDGERFRLVCEVRQ